MVKTSLRLPVRNAAGNGEERGAQISSIQDRLARLHRANEQIATEVERIEEEVKHMNHHEPHESTPLPAKEPN